MNSSEDSFSRDPELRDGPIVSDSLHIAESVVKAGKRESSLPSTESIETSELRDEQDARILAKSAEERKQKRKDRQLDAELTVYQKEFEDRSRHATAVFWLTFAQVIVVNVVFIVLVGLMLKRTAQMPSDRLILGWLASTVVEIIALYAIVLRGLFPNNCRSLRRKKKAEKPSSSS